MKRENNKILIQISSKKKNTIHTQLAIIIIIVRDKTRYDNNKILTNCSNLNLNSKKKLFFEKIDKIFRRVIITRSKINIARGKNWQRFTHRCLLDFVDSIERAFITIRMMQKKNDANNKISISIFLEGRERERKFFQKIVERVRKRWEKFCRRGSISAISGE